MQRMGSSACGSGKGSGKQHLDLPHDVLRLSDKRLAAGVLWSSELQAQVR